MPIWHGWLSARLPDDGPDRKPPAGWSRGRSQCMDNAMEAVFVDTGISSIPWPFCSPIPGASKGLAPKL